MKEFGSEKIIFVCTDSIEIFFSKLRSAGLKYNMPSFFSLSLTVHCLLTFFILFDLIMSQSTIIHLCREGSSWVEPVQSKD